MKNRVTASCYVTLLVLGMLLILHYMPRPVIAGQQLRAVDLLSDVRPKPLDSHPMVTEITDTLALMADTLFVEELDSIDVKPATPPTIDELPMFVDTCQDGMVCIEDYSDSTRRGMSPFYKALAELQDEPRTVRIAYYGDSFIEGDILTGDLRNMFQSRFGGRGVGYVPLSSVTMGFRMSVKQTSEGWERHTAMDTSDFEASKQDVANYYFRAVETPASVTLNGQKRIHQFLDTCYRASFFFLPDTLSRITAEINGQVVVDGREFSGNELQTLDVEGNIHSVSFRVDEAADSALFYGVCMDDNYGIVLDNLALRGSSGMNLGSVPGQTMKRFNELRPYDLIVLQYGLNVATEDQLDYGYYLKGMGRVIDHLKACYPQAGILIVSVADRDYRTEEGDVLTMPGIRSLVRYQQKLAMRKGVAFWNLFAAMGGDESMKQLVESTPPMANQDYTHINARGGRHLAELLFEAIMHGKEEFDKHYEPQNH